MLNRQTQSYDTNAPTDVLIVGAGPTGLMAAIELARRGITFRLIDKAKQRTPFSKALALHARTLEMLELSSAKLVDTFVRQGYTAPGANLSAGSQQPVVADFSDLDTQYPYLLIVPQAQTEELLEAHLATLGHTVTRGVELTHLTQTAEDVTAQLRYADERTEMFSARYVLGCDGAHSAVRHALNLTFPGRGYPWTAFLGDVKVEGDLARQGFTQFASNRGLAMLFPFQDGYVRAITIDTVYQHTSTHDELTLDELQDSINGIIPDPPRLLSSRWLTRWSAQLRQVPRYRVGRVFLAGDAAHIHSPAGGQGLNTGMQDAYNLAWKLALVLQGQAPEGLLNTYHAERHPVGQQVLRSSDILLRATLLPNPVIRGGRNLIIKTLVPLTPLQHTISENLSGIGISYNQTSQITRLRRQLVGHVPRQTGDRVPDLELKPADLSDELPTSLRLFALLRQAPYTLFIAIAPEHFERDQQAIAHVLQSVQTDAGEMIKSYLIFEQGSELVTSKLDTTAFIDFKQQFRHKLGTHHGSILLVRPDGYLAMHIPNLQQEQFLSKLRSWIVPGKQDIFAETRA